MSNYLKSTNFATKDSLPSGNAGKIVKGTEIDNEFNAIASAVSSKADLLNPTFSGLLTTDTLATTGAANIGGALSASGDTSLAADVQMTGTGRVLFPKGTTAQRPTSPTSGSVRFNTTLGYLENYTGTEWLPVGYVTPADVSDKPNTSTGYFQVPRGNIAQRPVTPLEGLIRYNSETDIYEGYINGDWHQFLTVNQGVYTISYVAIGGGSGGERHGGGAGQFVASTTTAVPGTTVISLSIGAGGPNSSAGSATTITGIASAIGGLANGYSGNGYAPGGNATNGDGEGNGGTAHGGGGGSSGAGPNASTASGNPWVIGGNGGPGTETLITGTSQTLAGGGGGAAQGTPGSGTAGGGNGSSASGASNGTPNTGGGGGGNVGGGGASGGSGVVFLKMPTINYTGVHTGSPTVTTTGSYTVLKYTGSGTYTC